MTATDNAIFTAANWNTYVRDNLLETMPGKATTAGSWFTTTAVGNITQRSITNAVVATSQTTTSTTYADLATVGPAVTITTGTTALVFWGCHQSVDLADADTDTSYTISGATTRAAADAQYRQLIDGIAVSNLNRGMACKLETGLTSGSNTFTMKYRIGGGVTGTFSLRELIVVAF